MSYHLALQNTVDNPNLPNQFLLQRWVNETLKNHCKTAEVTLRIVDAQESQALNEQYRNKAKPTNVLSFPVELPEEIELEIPLLGDLVLCADVIEQEAQTQAKPLEAHWAHMIIHGLLHLCGYDHQTDQQTNEMETLEIKLLNTLGYPNPYEVTETHV